MKSEGNKALDYFEAAVEKVAPWRVKAGQVGSIEVWAHFSLIVTGLCLVAFFVYEYLKQGYGLEYDLFYLSIWVSLAISILAHEISHVVMAKVLGCEKSVLVFHALGGIALFDREILSAKPWKMLLVCASGPLANFALVCMSWWCRIYLNGDGQLLLEIFGEMNLILLINLLPLYPLDGGRIFKAFMEILGVSQKMTWKSILCCSFIGYLGLLWFWLVTCSWFSVAELVLVAPLLSWITWVDLRSAQI